MRRSKNLLPAVLAALMFAAAGCGSTEGESDTPSAVDTTTTAAEAEQPPEAETEAPAETTAEATTTEATTTEATTTEATTTEATTETTTEEPEETPPQSTTNTTYDVGDFTVFVPEGWDAIAVPDYTESFDGDKILTNDILLAKGAEYTPASDYWNYDSGPYFYVTLADKETFTKVSTSRDHYVEEFGSVQDMEDMTTGSLTWHGFSVNPIGADIYIIWAEAGDTGFYSSISTAYGLSLQDEDVQTILSSLTLKE